MSLLDLLDWEKAERAGDEKRAKMQLQSATVEYEKAICWTIDKLCKARVLRKLALVSALDEAAAGSLVVDWTRMDNDWSCSLLLRQKVWEKIHVADCSMRNFNEIEAIKEYGKAITLGKTLRLCNAPQTQEPTISREKDQKEAVRSPFNKLEKKFDTRMTELEKRFDTFLSQQQKTATTMVATTATNMDVDSHNDDKKDCCVKTDQLEINPRPMKRAKSLSNNDGNGHSRYRFSWLSSSSKKVSAAKREPIDPPGHKF